MLAERRLDAAYRAALHEKALGHALLYVEVLLRFEG